MFKRIVLYILFSTSCIIHGQIELTKDVDVSDYPTISLSIHHPKYDYNKGFSVSQIINGDAQPSVVLSSETEEKNDSLISDNECVLILFEYSYHEEKLEQGATCYNALNQALDNIVDSGDEYNVCVFAYNNPNDKSHFRQILKPVNSNFTDKSEELKLNKKSFPKKSDFNDGISSNILEALDAGIEMIVSHPSDLPKSIILLSEERQNRYANNTTVESVCKKALEKNIRLDLVKYNRQGYFQHTLQNVSENTYGEYVRLTSSSGSQKLGNDKKEREIIETLNDLTTTISKRSLGSAFNLTIELPDSVLDGKNKKILIESRDATSSKLPINFNGKGNFITWSFQHHFIISLTTLSALVILILFVIYRIIIRRKNKKIIRQQKAETERFEKSKTKEQLQKQQQELSNLREKEANRINEKKREEEEGKEKKRISDLLTVMKSNGQLPILKVITNGEERSYVINHPEFKVGRDKSNNLVADFEGVSRQHFIITFQKGDYYIKDLNSTNGIKVNGHKVRESLLTNGDTIEIINLIFSFYK